jgi:hypothetical protein
MHRPTKLDAVTDLRRCIYASFSKDKFDDSNYKIFLAHAIKILKNMQVNKMALVRLEKSQDESLDDNKRREDLLTAAILLQI